MITLLETGTPLNLADLVALVREEGRTQAYRRDGSVYTVQLTPRTIAKRDALVAELLQQGLPKRNPEEDSSTEQKNE